MIARGLGEMHLAELSRQLSDAGVPFALATVIYRRAPVSAHLGDKAIVTGEGRIIGWIGGNCAQSAVRREAMAVIATGQPRLLQLTLDGAELAEAERASVTTVPMTCPSGGEVSIYIEPHVTAPQVVAIGETPVVRALAQLAPVLDFDVMLVGATELASLELLPMAFVVVASAGQYDEEALQAALRSPARYVGLVASRRRAKSVLDALASYGVAAEDIARVRTPAGLDIGGVSQEEIALSILAEIVQEYRAAQRELAGRVADGQTTTVIEVARDPVCGMDVEVAGARHMAEHGGTEYYFCCPHCRKDFLAEPERFLSA
ncbi:YHS domain-containing protein [bacterium]|nr:MAG: YHS domain-containing protein [bacterium]